MKRHPVDAPSLAFGVIFTGIATVFLFTNVDVATLHGRWLWPLPLIAVGLAILIAALPRRSEEREAEPSQPDADTEPLDPGSEGER